MYRSETILGVIRQNSKRSVGSTALSVDGNETKFIVLSASNSVVQFILKEGNHFQIVEYSDLVDGAKINKIEVPLKNLKSLVDLFDA